MFKRKDLDALLGVGRVRAPIIESESFTETQVTENSVEETAEATATSETVESEVRIEPIQEPIEEKSDNATTVQDRLYSSYESQIAFLQQQLAMKDAQLNSKDDIIKNFQVLLKLEQDTVLQLTYQMEAQKKEKGWMRWFNSKTNKSEATE